VATLVGMLPISIGWGLILGLLAWVVGKIMRRPLLDRSVPPASEDTSA
jgi:hypothetical protein